MGDETVLVRDRVSWLEIEQLLRSDNQD